MKTHLALVCSVVVASTLLCSCAGRPAQPAALSQAQQAFADQLFNNRGQWEVDSSSSQNYYCLQLVLYKTTKGPEVDCYYTDKAKLPTQAGAAFVFFTAKSFYVSQNSFQPGPAVDPANWGKLIPDKPSYRSAIYSVVDDDATKQTTIESLFRGYN